MATPKDARLMIAVPTMGSIKAELVAKLLKWQSQFPNGHLAIYFTTNIAPTDRARNSIVEAFLNMKIGPDQLPLTHLLMIDSDTVPQDDAPQRLLSHDVDVVSGMTPIANFNHVEQGYEYYDNCFERVDRQEGDEVKTIIAERHTGLRAIFRCGAACLMVKREVFEKLERPFFRFEMDEVGTKHRRSEDIYFCDTLKDAGFVLYADTDVICRHHKTLAF